MTASTYVTDVDEAGFERDVVQRSHEVPVVVDFWAEWCGPCRTLGPLLEQAVGARAGDVVLAKVDVDRNQGLAQRFGIRGIPAVKAFRDGQVVGEFTGALPRERVEAFLDQVVPTPADRLAARAADAERAGDREAARQAYSEALEADPDHRAAAVGLAGLLVDEDPEQSLALVKPHRPHPDAEAVVARAELAGTTDLDVDALRRRTAADPLDGEAHLLLGRALAVQQDYEDAMEHLLHAVRAGGEHRDAAREQLLSLFHILGDDHPLVRACRPRLASALF